MSQTPSGANKSAIAKTEASGGAGILPEVLAFTSSLALDRALLFEDVVGSLAHLTMLSRRGIIPRGDAQSIHRELVKILEASNAGTLRLPEEEDVHMAVEAELTSRLGEPAGLLHSARSRNDQVSLDLHLHVREQCAAAMDELATFLGELAGRAETELDTVLPSYTHRQRAQPVSLAYHLCGYGAAFVRDLEALEFVLQQVDALPLGVGAIAGTSLPIDREITRTLLQFSKLTANGLDTVGDRDFALDFSYAAARFQLHASRLSTDVIDFCSSEFGFAKLDGAIACGSSMMPQKRNPDVFELIRGKSGRAVGNLMGLLVMVKGLPGGYNRDLQEDRAALLEVGPMLRSVIGAMRVALPRVTFDRERCMAALTRDYTQATDLAEALVVKGTPFRTAYQAIGALVRRCQEKGISLAEANEELIRGIHPSLDAQVLQAGDPRASVARKVNAGGTGPASVRAQIDALKARASEYRARAAAVPRLAALFDGLKGAEL
jgi:argininosuccinate lyase